MINTESGTIYSSKRLGAILKQAQELKYQYYTSTHEVLVRWQGKWVGWDYAKQYDKSMTA